MIEGIKSAASSLQKSDKNISVIANNLANLNSVGYKKDSSFYHIIDEYNQPVLKEYTDFNQGEILPTANPLDFAISGDAFFVIEKDGEFLFTRNGKFSVDQEGFLVNEEGFKVQGDRGEINIKENMFDEEQTLTISKNGEIKIGNAVIDKLLIAKIENKEDLRKVAASNFALDNGEYTTAEESDYKVQQGFLESSNVSPIEEMENMIKTSKNYEAAQKMVIYLDKSLEKANEIGKV